MQGIAEENSWPTPTAEDSEQTGDRPSVDSMGATTLTAASRLWPSPDGSVFNEGQSEEAWQARHERELAKKINGNGGGTPLAAAAQMWPTPDSMSGGGESQDRKQELGRTKSGGSDLSSQAELWQTPATDSFRSRGLDRREEQGLDQQARAFWPTATARDVKNGDASPTTMLGHERPLSEVVEHWDDSPLGQEIERHGAPSSPSGSTSRRRLNPAFVEWLMGWPEGWSDCESAVTGFSRWQLEQRFWLSQIVHASA